MSHPNRVCGKCDHFIGIEAATGNCFLRPPAQIVNEPRIFIRPTVDSDDWCGCFNAWEIDEKK